MGIRSIGAVVDYEMVGCVVQLMNSSDSASPHGNPARTDTLREAACEQLATAHVSRSCHPACEEKAGVYRDILQRGPTAGPLDLGALFCCVTERANEAL
jgi:hypothetical protein